MHTQHIFKFKSDISNFHIPEKLNNPFSLDIAEIAKLASQEFQSFILDESKKWNYDFNTQKGKMFGILVVQKADNTIGYLGAVSGKLPGNSVCSQLVPSVFDESIEDNRFRKGMLELSQMGHTINDASCNILKTELIASRKQKSNTLQHWLFENYLFENSLGASMSVFEIFKKTSYGNPPSAAGECAAPKLLHFAIKNSLKPICMAEFWWGKSTKNQENIHLSYYPACKNKCLPILQFMLDDTKLYTQAKNELVLV